jgi:cytochrome c peroxidase
MYRWCENENGNFVLIEDGRVTTVFQTATGAWRGVSEDEYTTHSYNTAEAAMDAIDKFEVSFEPPSRSVNKWHRTQKGHLHKQTKSGFLTIKKATSGSYYVVTETGPVRNQWFESEQEAKQYLMYLG